MGWFDDNHWAGEAYDFGSGYMCGGRGLSTSASSSAAHRNFDGHYEPGTRKCSKCFKFKTKKDFNREQAAKPAKQRVCNLCGPGLPVDIGCMKVAELKQELERRGLSTKGPRDDLVERLKDDVEQEANAAKRTALVDSSAPAAKRQRKTVTLPPPRQALTEHVPSGEATADGESRRSSSSDDVDEDEVMKLLTRASKKGKQFEAAVYLWTCAQERRPLPKSNGARAVSAETLCTALSKLPGFDLDKFTTDRRMEHVAGKTAEHEPSLPKVSHGQFPAAGA